MSCQLHACQRINLELLQPIRVKTGKIVRYALYMIIHVEDIIIVYYRGGYR